MRPPEASAELPRATVRRRIETLWQRWDRALVQPCDRTRRLCQGNTVRSQLGDQATVQAANNASGAAGKSTRQRRRGTFDRRTLSPLSADGRLQTIHGSPILAAPLLHVADARASLELPSRLRNRPPVAHT